MIRLRKAREQFDVLLSGPNTLGTSLLNLIIRDNESPVVTVTATDPNASEDGPGPLVQGRYRHTATLLADGRVLLAGGRGNAYGENPLSSAELYDPASSTWTAVGRLNWSRESHTATLLRNGKVLVAGGIGDCRGHSSAELFDPTDGTWTPTGYMSNERWHHTATLLPDGKVLVAGGGYDASSELYDPATGEWTATGHYDRQTERPHSHPFA